MSDDFEGYAEWSDSLEQASADEMDAYFALRGEFEYQERVAISFPQDTAQHSAVEFIERYEPMFAKAA